MPFRLIDTDCSPLLVDYEYEVADEDLLAEYVGEMLLGHHYHVLRIIRSLSATLPIHPDDSIDKIIEKLTSASSDKRDGWLFQMISWLVLAKRNVGTAFYSNYPHFAPAQHGIDGLAIALNSDDSVKNIIITEDKCTTSPRGKITQQVFPDFRSFENGEKNNALVSIVSSLTGHLAEGRVLEAIQNNIFQNDNRLYRIGITRQESHNATEGRNTLFLSYDTIIVGDTARRSAASIYIPEMRTWMNNFATKVIAFLQSKKTQNV